MNDDAPAPTALDRLDTAWDNITSGISQDGAELDTDSEIIPRALMAGQSIPAATARRVWTAATTAQHRPNVSPPRRRTIRGEPLRSSLVFAGAGWLPAGMTAGIIALVMLGGVYFAGNRDPDHTPGLPGDASSVVATLVPAAPPWGTPGGEPPSSRAPVPEENG